MFDAIANGLAPYGAPGFNTVQWDVGQRTPEQGAYDPNWQSGEGGQGNYFNDGFDEGRYTPQVLSALGYTPPPGYDPFFSSSASNGGSDGGGPSFDYSADNANAAAGQGHTFRDYLKDQGITSKVGQGEKGYQQYWYDKNGQPVYADQWAVDPGDAFGLAVLGAGGLIGGSLLGAGALGGAGADGAASGGLASGLDFTPYTGIGSGGYSLAGDVAAAPEGFFGGAAAAGAPDVAGLTALDSAAYGAAGDSFLPVGAAAGGGGIGGFLGGAGQLLKDYPGLGSAIGGLGQGLIGSYTANKAIGAQTDAANNANALAKYQYDTTRADYAPYRAVGTQAVGQLGNLISNPSSITSDPGYQFGLSQGVQGIDRSAASRGGLYSGATLKALNRYGTDYGTTKLNDAYNRYGNVAQLGATGTAGTANAGNVYSTVAGNNTTGLGNALAGSALYSGNVWQNALNGGIANFNNSTYKPGP